GVSVGVVIRDLKRPRPARYLRRGQAIECGQVAFGQETADKMILDSPIVDGTARVHVEGSTEASDINHTGAIEITSFEWLGAVNKTKVCAGNANVVDTRRLVVEEEDLLPGGGDKDDVQLSEVGVNQFEIHGYVGDGTEIGRRSDCQLVGRYRMVGYGHVEHLGNWVHMVDSGKGSDCSTADPIDYCSVKRKRRRWQGGCPSPKVV